MVLGITPVLSVLRNFLEVTIFCILFLSLDSPRFSWKKTCIAYGAFTVIVASIGTVWVLTAPKSYGKYCVVVLFLQAAVFFTIMSRDTIFQCMYNLSLQMFILFFMLFSGIWCAKKFFGGNPWADLGIRIFYMALLAFVYIRWFRRPYRRIADSLRHRWMGICAVSLAGNILLTICATRPIQITLRSGGEQLLFISICVLLLMTHLVLLYTLHLVQTEMGYRQEMELTAVNNEMLRREIRLMQEQVETARLIRHDMRHHDLMVAEYAGKGEMQELLSYLDQHSRENDFEQTVRICENMTVDHILDIYIRQARNRGIEVAFDVVVPEQTGIKESIFITVLGNVMENAIHGCERAASDRRRTDIYIRPKAGKLVIKVINSCPEKVIFQEELPVRESGRGTGVVSIVHGVEECDGDVKFSAENGEFTTRILLNLSP